MKQLRRFLPMTILLILLLIAYFSGLTTSLSWQHFKEIHQMAFNYAQKHPILSPLLFIGVYIAYAALSIPGIFILSILAGCLFSQPFSTFYVVFSVTCGGSIPFLAARTAFGDYLHKRASPFLIHMEEGFKQHSTSYLLGLRLIPFFPFWIANIAPAFFGIHFFTFLWTTAIGTIPIGFVFTQLGGSLLSLAESKDVLSLSTLFNSQLMWALIGLAILSITPLLLKRR